MPTPDAAANIKTVSPALALDTKCSNWYAVNHPSGIAAAYSNEKSWGIGITWFLFILVNLNRLI